MASDIKLEGNSVVAEGHRFKIDGEDLELHSSQRLQQTSSEEVGKPRRAMVHGTQDQLIINYSQDYAQTELHGPLEIQDHRVPAAIRLKDRQGRTHVFISLGIVSAKKDVYLDPIQPLSGSTSLFETLQWLVGRIERLEQNAGLSTPSKIEKEKG